jgi:hypothetical protein
LQYKEFDPLRHDVRDANLKHHTGLVSEVTCRPGFKSVLGYSDSESETETGTSFGERFFLMCDSIDTSKVPAKLHAFGTGVGITTGQASAGIGVPFNTTATYVKVSQCSASSFACPDHPCCFGNEDAMTRGIGAT